MDYLKTKEKAKTDLKILTDFATDSIRHICASFGPRPCGEESERKALEYMYDQLKPYADKVWIENFKCNPDAFMSFVPIAGTCCAAATATNLIAAKKCKKAALGSLALLGTGVTGLVGEFLLYKKLLDPFFKEKESGNVIAVRKARGETKRRIILSGHIDSAPEWTYTYKLGSHGSIYVLVPAILGLVYTTATAAVNLKSKNKCLKKKLALGQLPFLPAYAGLYAFTNGKKYVDGANDDLTGC